ncbi:MAG: AAC(3) family N-acetyltransferase [Armatimonadetes bacterium]|nr:AAC(3) family N-acetyltransferase [Armatimonadota bacterium]
MRGFKQAGVSPGDVVFVHASLSRFRHVEGGVEALIEALLAAVGQEGTLAMPGFTFQLNDVPAPVFDVKRTPCWVSKVYERFRLRDGVVRSHHVTHSMCATGARAQELTATHSVTPCGAESPFRRLADWNAKILLLGVSHNSSTTLHAVEEQERVPYMGFPELKGATIIDESGAQSPIPTKVHDLSRQYDFNRMDEPLENAGIQRRVVIGGAMVRCVDAGRMFEFAVEAVRLDPWALAMEGEKQVRIAVSAEDAGLRPAACVEDL